MLEEPDGGTSEPGTQDEGGVVNLITDQETALGGGAVGVSQGEGQWVCHNESNDLY